MFGCVPIDGDPPESTSANFDQRKFRERSYRRVINRFPGQQQCPSDAETVNELLTWIEQPANEHIQGFKFKHPSQHGVFPEVTNTLLDRAKSIRLIVLRRKNFLRRAISLMNMQRIQSMQQSSNVRESVKLPPLNVDVDEVIRLTRYYESSQASFNEFANQFENVFEVEYEDLANDTNTVSGPLQEFLGVTQHSPLRAGTHQITPTILSNAISNFGELQSALAKQGLAHFLEQ